MPVMPNYVGRLGLPGARRGFRPLADDPVAPGDGSGGGGDIGVQGDPGGNPSDPTTPFPSIPGTSGPGGVNLGPNNLPGSAPTLPPPGAGLGNGGTAGGTSGQGPYVPPDFNPQSPTWPPGTNPPPGATPPQTPPQTPPPTGGGGGETGVTIPVSGPTYSGPPIGLGGGGGGGNGPSTPPPTTPTGPTLSGSGSLPAQPPPRSPSFVQSNPRPGSQPSANWPPVGGPQYWFPPIFGGGGGGQGGTFGVSDSGSTPNVGGTSTTTDTGTGASTGTSTTGDTGGGAGAPPTTGGAAPTTPVPSLPTPRLPSNGSGGRQNLAGGYAAPYAPGMSGPMPYNFQPVQIATPGIPGSQNFGGNAAFGGGASSDPWRPQPNSSMGQILSRQNPQYNPTLANNLGLGNNRLAQILLGVGGL